jgi:hypothetical protein
VPRQAALEVAQEWTMGGAPEPIIADLVDPLGRHRLQKAPAELRGRQGHGLPALILGILIAEAHVAVLDRETPAIGQRDPADLAAHIGQDLLRALDGGFAVDDPSRGPDRLGQGQVRAFLMDQREKPPAKALREGMDGHQGGRASRAPLGPIGGDPTGRDQAVHGRMVG